MVRVFIPDNSVTTGAGLSGLTNASTNLTIDYLRELDAAVTSYSGANIEAPTTIGTYQAPSSSSKIRFKETPISGVYELHVHDSATAFGTGDTSQNVLINIREATTTALKIGPNGVLIPLVPWDYQDGVRMGLTALPNAAAEAAGGLYTRGSGAGQINQPANGMVDVNNVRLLGTAYPTPTVAGVPNVNAKTWNDLATVALPLVPATAGRTLVVDAAGLADANTVKVGPTGSGTAQTARDLGGQLDAAISTRMATFTLPINFSSLVIDSTGRVNAFLIGILTSVFTEGATGRVAAAFKQFFNIATPAATMDHGVLVDTATTVTNAPVDSSGITTLLSRLSAARAGYLDNLSAGAVALEASLQALIATVGAAGAGLTAADDAVLAAIAALNNLSQANVRTALGLASANLDTQLAAISAFIDTEVAAIKAKTDNLPSDPADASDIAASFASLASTLTIIASYIDTEVAAIKAKTDNLPATPAAVGSAMTLTGGERDAIATAQLDLSAGVETGLTPRQALRLMVAALAGKLSGATGAATTIVIRNAVADSKDRISAVTDSQGNRSAVTVDLT